MNFTFKIWNKDVSKSFHKTNQKIDFFIWWMTSALTVIITTITTEQNKNHISYFFWNLAAIKNIDIEILIQLISYEIFTNKIIFYPQDFF